MAPPEFRQRGRRRGSDEGVFSWCCWYLGLVPSVWQASSCWLFLSWSGSAPPTHILLKLPHPGRQPSLIWVLIPQCLPLSQRKKLVMLPHHRWKCNLLPQQFCPFIFSSQEAPAHLPSFNFFIGERHQSLDLGTETSCFTITLGSTPVRR